jgi:hypothetical protein
MSRPKRGRERCRLGRRKIGRRQSSSMCIGVMQLAYRARAMLRKTTPISSHREAEHQQSNCVQLMAVRKADPLQHVTLRFLSVKIENNVV